MAEMTEHEKALLDLAYTDGGRIGEGKLFDYQEKALNELRAATFYLEKRYPEQDLEIISFQPSSQKGCVEIQFIQVGSDTEYMLKYENDVYSDNFYDVPYEEEYDAIVENSAVQAVVENASFGDVPQELINRYLIQQNQMIEYRASMYSYMYGSTVTPSDLVNVYMQNEGFVGTADDYLNSVARDMANQYLVLQTIADEQGINVTEEEIDEYLQNAYDSASSTAFSSFDEYKASLDLEVYREGLMAEKVVEYIVNNANVTSAATEDAAGEASSAVAE